MRRNTVIQWLNVLFLLTAIGLAGCGDEWIVKDDATPEGMERVRLTFSIKGIPQKAGITTRGTEDGTSAEFGISRVYIHIYDTAGSEIHTSGPLTVTVSASSEAGIDADVLGAYVPKGKLSHGASYKIMVAATNDYTSIPALTGKAYPAPVDYMSGVGDLTYDAATENYTGEVCLYRGVAKVRAAFLVADDAVPSGLNIDVDQVEFGLKNVPQKIRPLREEDAIWTTFATLNSALDGGVGRIDLPVVKTSALAAGFEEKDGIRYWPLYTYELRDKSDDPQKLYVKIPLFRMVGGQRIDIEPIERTFELRTTRDGANILRNYIYPLTITVKSAGVAELSTDMLEWDDCAVDGDILGTYLEATGIEMNQAGTLPLDYRTDGSRVYVDWSDMPATVKRSGTPLEADITYFDNQQSIPLEWTSAAGADKSYMGFVRNLKLKVGNIERTVEVSYIPTLTVDCHVIDMPLYSYVEGGTGSNNYNYYVTDAAKVFNTARILDDGAVSWLRLSDAQNYAAATLVTELTNSAGFIHCDENPYYGADRYAMIEYSLPDDTTHVCRLRVKQVVPVFVGYWGEWLQVTRFTTTHYYNEALYVEQIEEYGRGLVPYTSNGSPIVYNTEYDFWNGYTATFSAYQPDKHDNYLEANYSVMNYCAAKNRTDANGNIAAADKNWFAPSQYQLTGMIGLADRYDKKLAQSMNRPSWHYSVTDGSRGNGNGALGVGFSACRIGCINWGEWDLNSVRCVRTVGVRGRIEVNQVTKSVQGATGTSTSVSYQMMDLTPLPASYYSVRTLSLAKGSALGDASSEQNTAYKKLRIAKKYATTGTGSSATKVSMNWARAVGLPDTYNSQSAATATASEMAYTGCNGYWEDDESEKGTWRLPTAREAAIICTFASEISDCWMDADVDSWTQTEFNKSRATFVECARTDAMKLYMHDGGGAKTGLKAVRCVREEGL